MAEEDKNDTTSVEDDSNHMKGVKVVEGNHVPKDVGENIDVKAHQDAIDPDSNNNGQVAQESDKTKSVPHPKQSKVENPPASNTSAPKESHKLRSCILIGLLVLCVLCVLSCIGIYVFRMQLVQSLATTVQRAPDSTLTTVSDKQITNTEDFPTLFDQKRMDAIDSQSTNADHPLYTVTFTEDELLASILKDAKGVDPTAIALKFEPGIAHIQIDIGKVLQSPEVQNSTEIKNLPIDASLLEGITVSADIKTNEDGTKFTIENLTTGSPLLDSLIPPDLWNNLNDQLSVDNIIQSTSDAESNIQVQVKKVEFMSGKVSITIQE